MSKLTVHASASIPAVDDIAKHLKKNAMSLSSLNLWVFISLSVCSIYVWRKVSVLIRFDGLLEECVLSFVYVKEVVGQVLMFN